MIVSFGRGGDENISLLRIIMNAPPGYQAYRHNSGADKNYHYDYRRGALALRSDDGERANRHPAGASRRGRRDAMHIAGNHFERALANGAVVADPSLDRVQYEELLREMFRVADELFEKRTREAMQAMNAS